MGWNSEAVTAVTVIIDASSPDTGLFVYAPDQGADNLIASIAGAGSADQFGNFVFAGSTTYGVAAGGFAAVNSVGGLSFLKAPAESGLWSLFAFIEIDAASNLAINAHAGTGLVVITDSLQVISNVLMALAQTYDPSSPGTAETWHPMVLGFGWANSGLGNTGARFRMTVLNRVEIAGDISGGQITNGTVLATLPGAYFPLTQQRIPVTILAGAAAAPTNSPHIAFNGGGQLVLQNLPAGTSRIAFNGSISLDA